jgi:flagellar FliJ protein
MARFRFRIEPVLKARRRAEQEQMRAVAELEQRRLALEQELRRCQQEIALDRQELRGGLAGRIDLRMLRLSASASIQKARRARQAVLQLAGLGQHLAAARARLIEATKSRRAMELLRERDLRAYRAALDKAETAALDELAVQSAARRGPTP